MSKAIGIDFGSTYLKMAYNGQLIPNSEGDTITPAVVGLHKGEIFVGRRAVDLTESAPESTIASMKHRIGNDTLVKLGDKEYSPVEVSSLYLKKLKRDAELRLNDVTDRAVIAVPAYFTAAQRNILRKAGLIVGFSGIDLLDEPIAAVIGTGIERFALDKPKRILVFDLGGGGGSLDISILILRDGEFEIKNIEGDHWLGGNSFNQKIITYVLDYVKDKFGVDGSKDSRFMATLKKESERAKITLSSAETTKICLSGKFQDEQGIVDVEIGLNRKQFEQVIEER